MHSYTPTPFSLFSFSSLESTGEKNEKQDDTCYWSNIYTSPPSQQLSQCLSEEKNNKNKYQIINRNLVQTHKLSTSCEFHRKLYQFVCISCKSLLCQDCIKVGCSESSQLIHEVIGINVYMNRVRQDSKCLLASDLQQHNLSTFKQKHKQNLQQMDSQSERICESVQKCIVQIQRNLQKYLSQMERTKRRIQQQYEKQLQQRYENIEYKKAIQNILPYFDQKDKNNEYGRESEKMKMVAKNWDMLALHINKGKDKGNLNTHTRQLEKICTETNQCLIKSFGTILRQCSTICKCLQNWEHGLNVDRKQAASPKRSQVSNKNLSPQLTPSISKMQKKTSEKVTPISSSMLKQNQRQYLKSITNMLNKQINKKPTPIKEDKMKSRVQTTIKKSNNKENRAREMLMIQVYGGSHIKQQVLSKYTPFHNSIFLSPHSPKQPHPENSPHHSLPNHKQIKNNNSHIGFGAVNICHSSSQTHPQHTTNENIIVIGGYINGQMTDCIFRVNVKKNKKQLICRLDAPIAYFGVDSVVEVGDDGVKRMMVYMGGGRNQNLYALSCFVCYEFSESASVIGTQTLPNMDQPHHSLTLTHHHSNIYAIGGIDQQHKYTRTVTRYNKQTKRWSRIGDLCHERANHQSISLKSGLYVIGGYNGQNWLKSIERLDESKDIFYHVMELKEGRSNFGLIKCVEDNGFIVLGGRSYSELDTCEYVSLKDRNSKNISSLLCPQSDIFCFRSS